jgi:hypothetical protein
MIFFEVSADGASQHPFLPVALMVPSYRAGHSSWTFWQLFLGILAHIVSVTLFFMAGFTKMSIAPAEPLSNAAAEFAFELNEVFTVFCAVLNWYIAAFGTDELFSFEGTACVLGFVHGSHAVFPTPEVGSFAFEAQEVSVDYHRVLLGLPEVY